MGWFDSAWFSRRSLATGSIAVTWTDNEDGTGGVATVTNTTADATNTLKIVEFTGNTGSLGTAATGGTVVGSGDIAVTASTGRYVLYVVDDSTPSIMSTLHYAAVTNSTTAVESRLCDSVQTRIRSLGLSGIDSANIVVRQVPSIQNLTKPCIVVAPERPAQSDGGTNQRDDTGYGLYVFVVAADNRELAANLGTYTKWLDQMRRAFRNQRLADVAESVICRVEPLTSISLADWNNNVFAGGMIVRCLCRQTRGIT